MTSARLRSWTSGLTVQPRSASRGRTSVLARVMVERSTPHHQAGTSCVAAVMEMHERGQETVDEHQLMLRAGAHRPLPWPGRELGLVPLVPQRAYLRNEFSKTAADRPVILRLLMIASQDAFPTT
jgi:hypothetical protein